MKLVILFVLCAVFIAGHLAAPEPQVGGVRPGGGGVGAQPPRQPPKPAPKPQPGQPIPQRG